MRGNFITHPVVDDEKSAVVGALMKRKQITAKGYPSEAL